jgi:hypothetical protein
MHRITIKYFYFSSKKVNYLKKFKYKEIFSKPNFKRKRNNIKMLYINMKGKSQAFRKTYNG